MKYGKTKIIFFTLVGVIFILFVYLFMFYLSVTDTKNVKIEGYVYDKTTNKPIESAKIVIENYNKMKSLTFFNGYNQNSKTIIIKKTKELKN